MYTSEFSWNLRRFIYNTQITVSLRHRHQFTPYLRLSSWPSFLTHYHWPWAMWANRRSLKGLTWYHTPANLSPNSQLPVIRMRTCLQTTHSWLYKWHTYDWLFKQARGATQVIHYTYWDCYLCSFGLQVSLLKQKSTKTNKQTAEFVTTDLIGSLIDFWVMMVWKRPCFGVFIELHKVKVCIN